MGRLGCLLARVWEALRGTVECDFPLEMCCGSASDFVQSPSQSLSVHVFMLMFGLVVYFVMVFFISFVALFYVLCFVIMSFMFYVCLILLYQLSFQKNLILPYLILSCLKKGFKGVGR